MLVKNILSAKGADVRTVRPNETIETLTHRLRLERIGALVVSNDGETVEGIISERDIVHGLALHGNELLEFPVSELMTSAVVTCELDASVGKVMELMTLRRIRHLPVMDGDRLAGIISIGDVVKHRLDEMQLETNVLRDYAIASR